MANIKEIEAYWMTAISLRDIYTYKLEEFRYSNEDISKLENDIGSPNELTKYQKYLELADELKIIREKLTLINKQRLEAIKNFS